MKTVSDKIVTNTCFLWIPSTLPWWFNGPFISYCEPYYRAAEYTHYYYYHTYIVFCNSRSKKGL